MRVASTLPTGLCPPAQNPYHKAPLPHSLLGHCLGLVKISPPFHCPLHCLGLVTPPLPPDDSTPGLMEEALWAAASPIAPQSPQTGSSPHNIQPPGSAPDRRHRKRRRGRCQCSAELLKSEEDKRALLQELITKVDQHREEVAALREQQQRHHDEVMAYRRKKLSWHNRPASPHLQCTFLLLTVS